VAKGDEIVAQLPAGREIHLGMDEAIGVGATDVFDGIHEKRQRVDEALAAQTHSRLANSKVRGISTRRGPGHEAGIAAVNGGPPASSPVRRPAVHLDGNHQAKCLLLSP
jgi:hypothetical protein